MRISVSENIYIFLLYTVYGQIRETERERDKVTLTSPTAKNQALYFVLRYTIQIEYNINHNFTFCKKF